MPRQTGIRTKASGKAKGKNRPTKQQARRAPNQANLGAAVHQPPRGQVGMKDLMGHEVSFIAGYVYVGNGTLGATDDVYVQDVTKTYINKYVAAASGYQVPVSPTMSDINGRYRPPAYVTDVLKHFSRTRVRSARVELVSLQPATSNSMIAQVSPVRGAGDSASLNMNTGVVAGPTFANAIGMAGTKSCTSYQHLEVDFSQFIAGGFGSQQNEFTNDIIGYGGTNLKDSSIPCAMVITGQNNTAALRGTQTHAIVYRFKVDLLDFIAGVTPVDLPALMWENPSEELLVFIGQLGGTALLKLYESKRAKAKEERSITTCC